MSNIDVVITGLGATTPLGGDVQSTWDGLLAGQRAVPEVLSDAGYSFTHTELAPALRAALGRA